MKGTLVHESAHVVRTTFADGPTPERIKGTSALVVKRGEDTHGKKYHLGESGARAEVVLTRNQGQFSVAFQDKVDPSNVDFTAIDHVVLTGKRGKE
ncbi:hypothetical protein K503DRAFT_366242 [Rhizopogon vinicolor AM-OR11-026]|uniref:Uncharacterized protein n=1 Tax=Rhizopogon vinicolor AM-OR11-026 TaxID=1314800 RepID=A0A1B7MSG7_9AGAM|nr:hypothetical protein K503DRAFT_366242 [Rhizopogon vinicolor AM-OR11-026]